MKPLLLAFLLALSGMGVQPVWAHGGEDHGDAAPALPQVGQAPRAAADTEEFEMVAVLTGGSGQGDAKAALVLTLYLDRFASNQPVADATVEIESGAFKAVGKALAPGVYTVSGEAFDKPGRYPLTVSVQTADGADLLDAALEYGPSKPDALTAQANSHALWSRWYWGVAAALGVAVLAVLARRRGRTR